MVKIRKKKKIAAIIITSVILLVGGIIGFGAINGWFGEEKVVLSEQNYGDFVRYDDIDAEKYETMVNDKESFVLLVDQFGCNTADNLRKFVEEWATKAKVKVQRIMFSEMKETSLHDFVKYYPSLVVVERGRVRAFLRADSDEDAEEYNDYEALEGWIERYV